MQLLYFSRVGKSFCIVLSWPLKGKEKNPSPHFKDIPFLRVPLFVIKERRFQREEKGHKNFLSFGKSVFCCFFLLFLRNGF